MEWFALALGVIPVLEYFKKPMRTVYYTFTYRKDYKAYIGKRCPWKHAFKNAKAGHKYPPKIA